MDTPAQVISSPIIGGAAVFVVAATELAFTVILLKATSPTEGRRCGILVAIVAVSAAIAILSFGALRFLGSSHPVVGGITLLLLGFYLSYRFGNSRSSADGGEGLYVDILPVARRDQDRDGFHVSFWATAIEAIKAGVAWLGVMLVDGWLAATIGLALALVVVAGAKTFWRGRALTAVPPSLLYGLAVVMTTLHGLGVILVATGSNSPLML